MDNGQIADIPCLVRDTGIPDRSVLCVCNANHCDTITREPPAPGEFVAYTTTHAGKRFEKSYGRIEPINTPPTDNADIPGFYHSAAVENPSTSFSSQCGLTTVIDLWHRIDDIWHRIALRVNLNRRFQFIEGFGGSVTDAAAINWKKLSEATQTQFINSYFSKDGLEYNMIRVPIGGADFSTHPYTLNDYPWYDAQLSNFSLTEEDYDYKVIAEADPSQTTSELAAGFGASNKPILIHLKQMGKLLKIWSNDYGRSVLSTIANPDRKARCSITEMVNCSKRLLFQDNARPHNLRHTDGCKMIGAAIGMSPTPTILLGPCSNRLPRFSQFKQFFLPMIKRCQEVATDEVKITASTWSPPVWMKTNEAITGFGQLRTQYYQAYADYHLRFLEEYAKENVKIWAITTTNEPINGIVPFVQFNSLGWFPAPLARWIANNLGPTIRNSQFADTLILGIDDQRYLLEIYLRGENVTQLYKGDGESKKDEMIRTPIITSLQRLFKSIMEAENMRAIEFLDGTAVHYYGNFAPASILDSIHETYPNKIILATEACEGPMPWHLEKVEIGSWRRARRYVTNIMQDLNHYVVGWIDWNMCLDPNGGPNWADNFVDAPILVFEDQDEFVKQPMFYAMGHFSKFIPRGSRRLHVGRRTILSVDNVAVITPEGNVSGDFDVKDELRSGPPVKSKVDTILKKKSKNSILVLTTQLHEELELIISIFMISNKLETKYTVMVNGEACTLMSYAAALISREQYMRFFGMGSSKKIVILATN
ncbi:Glucosylceramidase [Eumeta japonica]|uniref:Glucosylceramidase n=1 Tax=Eumeta variegata TaxID=151549 RepID=A0A4C1VXG0_EUMVA|nr:Glucosylceramidase [Eumeta japonica]